MLKVLHGSDVHFGKPHRPSVATAFLEMVGTVAPDVIVLAGDFTQRAKVREYEQARTFLRQVQDVPVVVTPGNHDIPLYRVLERLFAPFRNYRAFISEELDTVTRVGGSGSCGLELGGTSPRTRQRTHRGSSTPISGTHLPGNI